jgi:hypothetical protein
VRTTISLRWASRTPWAVTKQAQWSNSIRVHVKRRMCRCTKSRCHRWFSRSTSKRSSFSASPLTSGGR